MVAEEYKQQCSSSGTTGGNEGPLTRDPKHIYIYMYIDYEVVMGVLVLVGNLLRGPFEKYPTLNILEPHTCPTPKMWL